MTTQPRPKNPAAEQIRRRILFIRGHKVMLDSDLAELYEVETKVLNQAVKRNIRRFPGDFMFQLTRREKEEVVTICDHLKRLKFSSALPYAFTEHGAIMLAAVLNTRRAVAMSICVVRAFSKIKEWISLHRELAQKLMELERKIEGHDHQIRSIFDAIRQLTAPPETPRRRIGFHPE